MKTIKDVCIYIGGLVSYNPVCVETGCTYVVAKEEHLVHTTTNNIVEFICLPRQGTLVSLDIDESHIEFSKKLIYKIVSEDTKFSFQTICVKFELGDSVGSLNRLQREFKNFHVNVDVLCLDSKEFDEDHMVNEYNAIKDCLAKKHFVLVDDIHNQNSVKYKKMVPFLKRLGYSYIEVPTPTGLFLASKGYPLPTRGE